MQQVLVKVGGRKKSRAQIHIYDAKTDSALCRPWPKPGAEWEVQTVNGLHSIPFWRLCYHCRLKEMRPEQPKPPTAQEKRRQRDLERLAAWTGAKGF